MCAHEKRFCEPKICHNVFSTGETPPQDCGIPKTHMPFDLYMIALFTYIPELDNLEVENENIKLLLSLAKNEIT